MKKLLCLLLCLALCLSTGAWAASGEETEAEPLPEEGFAAAGAYYESAEGLPLEGAGAVYLSDLSGYTHNEAYSEKNVLKGIDVSVFQGNIDWAAVKAAGVDFAILRCGGRLSVTGKLYEDGNFEKNIKGALAQGIRVGVYFFSQAITKAEAEEEAAEAIRILGSYGSQLTLPVYLDVEYVNNAGRLYDERNELGAEGITKNALAFCAAIEKAGLKAGVYAGYCSFPLYETDIAAAGYEVWHAQWYSHTTLSPVYTVWQFSDSGAVSGISGSVDLDFRYEAKTETKKISFEDVKESDWYYDSVNYVVDKGLFNGTGNNKFSPTNPMTREMFVTVLYRLAGQPEVSGQSSFSDVTDPDSWYYKAVVWAAENNIVTGLGNGSFGTGKSLNRQQMVTFLQRYAVWAGLETASEQSLDSFPDAPAVSAWAAEAMTWAVEQGILTGTTRKIDGSTVTVLAPTAVSSRAQVAAVVARFAALLEEE